MIRLLLLWIRRFGVPARPQWLVQWMHARLYRHNIRHFLPQIMAAQAAQADLRLVWAEPGTPPSDILGWFDAQIADGGVPPLLALDLFRVALTRCSEEQWEESNSVIDLPSTDVLADWIGHRSCWEAEGRALIAAAVPAHHEGLCLMVDGADTAVRTALRLK